MQPFYSKSIIKNICLNLTDPKLLMVVKIVLKFMKTNFLHLNNLQMNQVRFLKGLFLKLFYYKSVANLII